jgi:hypothetical protein
MAFEAVLVEKWLHGNCERGFRANIVLRNHFRGLKIRSEEQAAPRDKQDAASKTFLEIQTHIQSMCFATSLCEPPPLDARQA